MNALHPPEEACKERYTPSSTVSLDLVQEIGSPYHSKLTPAKYSFSECMTSQPPMAGTVFSIE